MARKAANKTTKAAKASVASAADAKPTKKPDKSTNAEQSKGAKSKSKADAPKGSKADKPMASKAGKPKAAKASKASKADKPKAEKPFKKTKASKAASIDEAEIDAPAERPRVIAKTVARDKNKVAGPLITVRHMQRRDIDRVWDFLKLAFREVNIETVEYQRPRSKHRFEEIYEEEGIEQLVFEVDGSIVAYAECSFEPTGADNWINPRYFEKREMKPLFVDELAVHPDWHGRGVGSFLLEQLHHLARVHGLNHIVLEVAENNENAFEWYKKRHFKKLDAAIFMAVEVEIEPELLPPRELPSWRRKKVEAASEEAAE